MPAEFIEPNALNHEAVVRRGGDAYGDHWLFKCPQCRRPVLHDFEHDYFYPDIGHLEQRVSLASGGDAHRCAGCDFVFRADEIWNFARAHWSYPDWLLSPEEAGQPGVRELLRAPGEPPPISPSARHTIFMDTFKLPKTGLELAGGRLTRRNKDGLVEAVFDVARIKQARLVKEFDPTGFVLAGGALGALYLVVRYVPPGVWHAILFSVCGLAFLAFLMALKTQYLVIEIGRDTLKYRGEDDDQQVAAFAAMINQAVANLPPAAVEGQGEEARAEMAAEQAAMAEQAREREASAANAEFAAALEAHGFFRGLDADRVEPLKVEIRQKGWAGIFGASHRVFMADAEALAEGGVGEFINRVAPFLEAQRIEVPHVEDEHDENGYTVCIDGHAKPIYEPRDLGREEAGEPGLIWGLAMVRSFALVDELLAAAGSPERLYAVNGGNDLHAFFLTPELQRVICAHPGVRASDMPYKPAAEYPGFGMLVEEE